MLSENFERENVRPTLTNAAGWVGNPGNQSYIECIHDATQQTCVLLPVHEMISESLTQWKSYLIKQ